MIQLLKKRSSLPPKWLRVLLPSILILVWFGLSGVGGPYFGKISQVASNDQSTFLPSSAESTQVNKQLSKFQDSSAIPALLVFSSQTDITDAQQEAIKSATTSLTSNKDVKGEISPPIISDDKKAALVVVNVDSGSEYKTLIPALKDKLASYNLGIDYKITGPVGFLADLTKAFSGIDGLLLLVALAVVFVILLIVYRSPLLPFIVLFNAIAALSTAILVVWHLADADVIQINGQVQGILFILVIGAATDYSLLFVSRYREELEHHVHTWDAIKAALKGSFEPILAAGGTVIVGLLCLLLSDLNSNKALGPVGAIGIALAIISALTFLPAMLLAFGRRVFWPKTPKYSKLPKFSQSNKGIWKRVAKLVSAHPRAIWLSTSALLIMCTFAIGGIKASGVPQSEVVLGASEARDGQKILDAHFPSGSGTPAQVIVPLTAGDSTQTISRYAFAFDQDKGVDSVSVVSSDSSSGMLPLGKNEAEIKQKILDQVTTDLVSKKAAIRTDIEAQAVGAPQQVIDTIYDQAVANIPDAATIAAEAYPFKDATPKIVDSEALLQVTLKDNADSRAAEETIVRLRSLAHTVDPAAKVGGTSAVQLDTNTAASRDREVVIPAVLIVITLILMVLLRSLLAPILLLLTTIISFTATLGVSTLVFNQVFDFPGADPSVVLYAFIFLVALGIDYNIFLMTRVREESLKIGTKKGVTKGLVVTGGVITSAGVVLAATFAALGVIPILFLAQLAFTVAFGVLLDTTIVRSLLVPALVYDIGKASWWPSKRFKD